MANASGFETITTRWAAAQVQTSTLDELAKMMTNAAGAAKGVRDEIATLIKTQTERLVHDLDLVSREEFEAIKSVAMNARMEVEHLHVRLGILERESALPVKKMIHSKLNPPVRRRSPAQKYQR